MFRLEDLQVFVRAAEAGSLTAAARMLDCSAAVASAALGRLETALGQRLLLRTTRHMRLAPAGERFLPYAREALATLEAGQASLAGHDAPLTGQLRISAPSDLGRNLLRVWLDEFQAQHPALCLRIQLGDRLSNLFREPVDVALRYGSPQDESLIAHALAPANRCRLVASSAYLRQQGEPQSPEDLGRHACLLYTVGDRPHDRWPFVREGRSVQVAVSASRIADDGELVRRWALDGHGIASLSCLDVWRDLQDGHLVEVLPDWSGELMPLFLVCAQRSTLSPGVTALRQFLTPRLARIGA